MGCMNYPGKQPAVTLKAVTLKVVLDDLSADGRTVIDIAAPPISISLVGADGESNVTSQIMSEQGERRNSRIAAFLLDGFSWRTGFSHRNGAAAPCWRARR